MDGLKVLIVADDPLARAGLAAVFTSGHDVTVVGQIDGQSAAPSALDVFRPTVVVWDLGWDPAPGLDQLSATIGHEGQERFHLIPIVYLESMCAFQDPDVFITALKTLQVDETWLHPDSDPSGEWHRAMPDPLPLNPILEAVAGDFLTFGTPTYGAST